MNKLFILDTVVLLQAMMSRTSGAFAALQKADRLGTIIVSNETLEELFEKICAQKFDKYQPRYKRIAFYNYFCLVSLNIEVLNTIQACRDPKNDKFLSLAITADADCVVTRDSDLLVLHPFRGIPIITTGAFLQMTF
jgi:uncharacterized protein